MLTVYYIENIISIKCKKRADTEKYIEYLIHYPFFKRTGKAGRKDGAEQRFDSAECEDYRHVFHHLPSPPPSFLLLSCHEQ